MSSAVTNLWRQFVQRRLWPVAILLVAALAAVPMALSKEPAPPAPAPAPPAPAKGDDELAVQPIVAPAEARDTRRKVLGASKNPFGIVRDEEKTPSATPPDSARVDAQPSQDRGAAPGTSPSTGGSVPPTTVAPTPVTPAEPTPAPKRYALHEITVRFGGADDSKRQSVKRLQALPSEQEPVLIYMGVLKDGKTAVFLVGDGVDPVGDGECNPTPQQCETIRLRAGETEFLDIKDEAGTVTDGYQLDLIKIHGGRTSSDSPTRSRAGLSTAGPQARRSELRSTVRRVSARLP